MSKARRVVLAVLAGGVLAAASPAHAQTTLTMSSWVSPQHHITAVVLQGWANEAEKVTHGRVKFQMLPKHPSAPPGTFDAVREGLVDLSYVTASYTPARHIVPMLAELPGAGETSLINSVAYSRIYWKHLHKVGEYRGVKLLGVFTHGPGQMFTTRPVRHIADVQGLKILTGGGVAEAVAKARGADRRRLDQAGGRQGHRRRQDPRRVPGRAEKGRRGAVSAPARGWEHRVEAILGAAASAILLAMMLLTVADVTGRYLFNRPVRGAFEVTELMLVVLIFAGLPLVSYADEHALMDFVDRLLRARTRRLLEGLVHLVCAAVMLLLAWL